MLSPDTLWTPAVGTYLVEQGRSDFKLLHDSNIRVNFRLSIAKSGSYTSMTMIDIKEEVIYFISMTVVATSQF